MNESIELVLAVFAILLACISLVFLIKTSKRFSKCERKIHDV